MPLGVQIAAALVDGQFLLDGFQALLTVQNLGL